MAGCDSAPACRASARNRSCISACPANSARSSLTATGRVRTVSSARQTSPTPPAAIWLSRRYRPASSGCDDMTAFDPTSRRRTRPALGKIGPGGGFGSRCEDRSGKGREGRGQLNLEPAEARRRFAAAPVARLATVSPDGRPHLVPVTFTVDGDVIYSAVDAKPKTTTRLARLRNIAAEPRVAMLADHYEADWDRLWWARADGTAAIPAGRAEMAAPPAPLASRHPRDPAAPPGGPGIRVQVGRWTRWGPGAGEAGRAGRG